MNRSDALEALRTAAVDVLQVKPEQVVETATFAEDLEADSLDLVELVMSLEDSLDVKIEEDDLGEVKTVGDAVDLIVAASAAKA
jgi:acyl carrier protein